MRIYQLLFFAILFSVGVNAQDRVLTGTVVDFDSHEALISAYVIYEGGNTITDSDGKYSIESDQESIQITISYIGYTTETFTQYYDVDGQVFKLSTATNIFDPMTVTASKYEQRVSESTVSIDVLSSEYISSTNAASAEDVLDKVSGVQMIDGQANIRGGSGFSYGAGSRVLLLVDDMPALQVDAGVPNWNDLPIEATDQFEIVKGAASALYGSSALNGIINLRRIKPTSTPRTEIGISTTMYGDLSDPQNFGRQWFTDDNRPNGQQYSALHAQKFGEVDLMVHGLYRKLDSWNQDTYENRYRLGFSTSYRVDDKWLFTLSSVYNHIDNSSFFIWANAVSGIYQPYPNSISTSNSARYNVDPVAKYFADNGDVHTIRTRFSRVDNNNNNNQGNTSNTYFGEYQYQTELAKEVHFVGGLTLMHSKSDSELFGDTTFTANNMALYAQLDKKFVEKLSISAGVRYEYNQQTSPDSFGGFTIPDGEVSDGKLVSRLGLNYTLAQYSSIRASFGQGYRFPTITERFITTTFSSFTIYPNPELNPEKGFNGEIGVKQGVKLLGVEGFLDAAIFRQKYQDMTEFVLVVVDNVTGFQSQNVGATIIDGIELSFMGRANIGPVPITMFGGYTYLDPRYENFTENLQNASSSTENVLKYRSKHNAKFDIEGTYKGVSLGLAYNRTSHVLAIDSAFELLGGPQLGDYRAIHNKGYRLINTRVSYKWKSVKFSFLIDNLTDVEYTQRPGLLEAPRNMTLRLDYRVGA